MTEIRDRPENFLHCSLCNSWFHLISDCPEKQQDNVNFAEQPTEIEPGSENEQDYDSYTDIDRSVDEYNLSHPHDTGTQQHIKHLYLSLEHSRHLKIDSPSHETLYMHNLSDIPPHLDDILRQNPHLNSNIRVRFRGYCFDESSEHNIVGNFIRLKGNDILNKVLGSDKLNFTIEQWVYNKDS